LKDNLYTLTDNEIEQLKTIYFQRNYKKDEVIFFEGESGEGLFLIKEGKVKIVKMGEDGEEQILDIYGEREIFAEIFMFDSGPYPATAIAMEDSVIYLIETKKIKLLMQKYPEITLKIIKLITDRLRRAQKSVHSLGLKNARSRTAGLLLYLAEKHGEKTNNKIMINMEISQQEMASMIGITRETISRILNKFRKNGYIKTSRKNIYIIDKDKLKMEL